MVFLQVFGLVFELKPDLSPRTESDSNSFPQEARKNEGAILENITTSFSEPEVRASREKITSNMTAFIGGKSGLKSLCKKGLAKFEKSFLLNFYSFLLIFLMFHSLQADQGKEQVLPATKSRLSKSDLKILNEMKPYLMPDQHPAKARLDALFSSSRVVLNMKTLQAAGFKASGPRKYTKIIVATHPDFPEYFFKLFIDAQLYERKMPVYEYWAQRIKGSRLIQEQIDKNGWQHLFKVPVKFLYVLPSAPASPREFFGKNYLLVEDNMNIHPDEISEAMWKSENISHELLDALFFLAKTLNLRDSLKPANIPFSKDGKVAFVDTPIHKKKVVLKEFNQFLSSSSRTHWKQLCQSH